MTAPSQDFIAAILAVEAAAAELAEAGRSASIDLALSAAARGQGCPQILIEAAELIAMLGDRDRAHDLLRRGLALDGPTAPLQHAYSRQCRAKGDLAEARRWLRGAMLRARPNAAMALELCEIALALGDDAEADAALRLSVDLRWLDAKGLRHAADRLIASARPDLAVVALMMAYRRGGGDPPLRRELAELLRHQRLDALPAAVRAALKLDDPMTAIGVAAAAAQDALTAAFGPELFAAASRREASPRWIHVENLWPLLRARIAGGDPFSWVRGSDGEGRFVAALHPELRPGLSQPDVDAMFQSIWHNWFGQRIGDIGAEPLQALVRQVDRTYANADLVGLSSVAMLRHDPKHFAYRAALDMWLQRLDPPSTQLYNEAYDIHFLNERDPFLARLLADVGFVGVISPHRDLAPRLASHLGIDRFAGHVIPGETRLGRDEERRNRGEHFPGVFTWLMETITIPHRGAVFLVAGGLLGKVYCNRIKELGGIALDIGSLADLWMGHNTRGGGVGAAALPA